MSERVNLYAQGQRLEVSGMTEWSTQDGRSGTRFTRIGTAFINRDGSMNIVLDFLPAQGQRLHVRPALERKEGAPAQGSDQVPF